MVFVLGIVLSGCGISSADQIATAVAQTVAVPTRTPTITPSPTEAAPRWGDTVTWDASDGLAGDGIRAVTGGDVDTVGVVAGSPPQQARRTGNGEELGSEYSSVDYYLSFSIDDEFLFDGSPTTHVEIIVEYFDEGTDQFTVEYDAIPGGPGDERAFKLSQIVLKTDSGEFREVTFYFPDALFANRQNGQDFRISDWGDGAETIRRVTVTRIMPDELRVLAEALLASALEHARWEFGPRSGRLYHNHSDDFLEARLAYVQLRDFIAESVFVNPYSATWNTWDFGLGFRFETWDIHYRLVVTSDREWFVFLREGDNFTDLADGTVPNLHILEGESNKLQLMVVGTTGYFFLNDRFIAQFNLQEMVSVGGGGVFVGTGFYIGNEVGGYFTDYEDFTVWSLPD
jgi:hypothetical protein